MWKFVKTVKNKQNSMPPLKVDNKIYISPEEKCELIKKQFESAHKITSDLISPMENKVNSTVRRLLKTNRLLSLDNTLLSSPAELMKITKNLHIKKATGTDMINNKCLKKLPIKAIIYLNFIFNGCFKIGYFPTHWKQANIISIPKAGKDKSLPESYRPISLLSSIGKTLEKLIANRIRVHTEAHNIIPASEFGFQPSLSTTHQLDRLTKSIKYNSTTKKSTGMVLP